MIDEEGDDEAEIESAVERLQSREHNESLMRLAKETGKELYITLSNSQRRAKIASTVRSMLDQFPYYLFCCFSLQLRRLEVVTEIETVRRYELFSRIEGANGPPCPPDERKRLEKEADACESRRQALVLLLLHYSAGLQSVEEADLHQNDSPVLQDCDP